MFAKLLKQTHEDLCLILFTQGYQSIIKNSAVPCKTMMLKHIGKNICCT